MSARSKQTESRWRSLIREQEASGKTVKEFARRCGLSAATFYWWRCELGRRGRAPDAEPLLRRADLMLSLSSGVRI